MISPAPSPGGLLARASVAEPPAPPAVDALRLLAQGARLAEAEEGLRPFLELLRRLLNAHAVGWLENPAQAGWGEDTFVSNVAGAAAALAGLRESLDARRAAIISAEESSTLSTPVEQAGVTRGWLVAQVPARHPRELQAVLILLQVAGGFLFYRQQRNVTRGFVRAVERASGLLEILRAGGDEPHFDKAVRGVLEALTTELGCSRLYLAFRRRGRLKMEAISGVARIDWKSASLHPVEAAMREALDEPVLWSTETPLNASTAAHAELARETGARRLLTLPLPEKRGALTILWNEPTTVEAERALAAAAPFVPVLFGLLDRARPNPLLFTARRGWEKLSRHRRQAVIGAGVAFAALLATPFHYTLHVGCRLAPVTKQVIAAPFQAQLKRTFVRPGDRVAAGQPMGEMDSRELKLKEAELLAARERALKQRDRALANQGEGSDFAAAQVANFEAQSVNEDLALVQRKLSLLNVTSPLAGTVVSGDLRRAEGQPVQQGQILWEVAPLEEMVVELEVPDRDIAQVREGQIVGVRLEAVSGAVPRTAIQRLHPQSEATEGANVFICEAPVRAGETAELRPGMRGRATIETARRPLIWILGHRLWEWAVTALFW